MAIRQLLQKATPTWNAAIDETFDEVVLLYAAILKANWFPADIGHCNYVAPDVKNFPFEESRNDKACRKINPICSEVQATALKGHLFSSLSKGPDDQLVGYSSYHSTFQLARSGPGSSVPSPLECQYKPRRTLTSLIGGYNVLFKTEVSEQRIM